MEIRAASYRRLLNTKTLRLEQFFEGQIPEYAIFSHRWTDQEVLFPSMEFLDENTTMKGYHKIVNLCKIAVADGHHYVWIDTACINRQNQVELSEAVSSMFGYYEQAELCYAYLEDVDKQHPLAESQWFTRGWTLPELIAPKTVEFLDSHWTRLGTRESLADQIATITSIPTPVLRGHSIKNYNAACRMSWAADRSTSLEVDGAYCLLGLFDIKTSLGSTKGAAAFRRLQQLILEKYEDYTLLVWDRTEFNGLGHILAPSAEFFQDVDNTPSYRDMQKSLTRNRKLSLLASKFITGTPGGRPQVTPDGLVLTLPIRQTSRGIFQVCLTTCSKPEYNFVCFSLKRSTIMSSKPRIDEYYRTGSVLEFVPMASPFQGPKFEYEKMMLQWFDGDDRLVLAWSGTDTKLLGTLDNREDEKDGATKDMLVDLHITKRSELAKEKPRAPENSIEQDKLGREISHHIPTLPTFAPSQDQTSSVKDSSKHAQHDTDLDPRGEIEIVGVQQVSADSGYATGSHGQSNPPQDKERPQDTPPEDSDIRTEFSGTDRGDQGYVSELAEAIFHAVELKQFDASKMEQISKMLPGLLRAFSLRLGSNPSDSTQAEAAYWVRKYRERICNFFEDNLPLQSPVQSEPVNKDIMLDRFMAQTDEAEQIPLPEPIAEAEVELSVASDVIEAHDAGDSDGSEDEDGSRRNLYRGAIMKSWAYQWLMASLQRETTMKRPVPDLMGEFENTILSALPSTYHQLSRRAPSKTFTAVFELDWTPIRFLQEQKCTDHDDEVDIRTIITLTGELDDAQAMTAESYMFQTWPATGPCTLQLVADTIQDAIFHQATASFQDGTTLEAYIDGDRFIVTCAGTGDSIAEVGGQLGWIGAALRSSQIEAGVSLCSPSFQRVMASVPSSDVQTVSPDSFSDITFQFHFDENGARSRLPIIGDCWHRMFRNPVMVTGYPIPIKSAGLGLELPLDMMAELAGADRAVEFDGKIFVKGFSTMLIATRVVHDLLVWHYHYNSQGKRISYLDHNITPADEINLFQLQNARHVVGWCANSKYYAGAQDADYQSIKRTGLEPPSSTCILEKITLSGGKFLTAGGTFALSVKDIAPHVTREHYIDQLNWIREQYVVFWDDADHEKRGWLVNGSSALLHLVRASLHRYSTGKSHRQCLFNPSQMKNETEHTENSAHDVLLNDINRALKVWPGKYEIHDETESKWTDNNFVVSKSSKRKKAYVLFQDLVERHYRNLEIMMEYQKLKAGQSGVHLKLRARKHLEGWDFVDLISDRDLHPRVATLQRAGYGWVDLIRSINATSILGCGFGDLIKPDDCQELCPDWTTLPKGKYYLAAHISDLRDIFNEYGSGRNDNSLHMPIQGLNWHCAGNAPTASCQQCDSQRQLQRHSRRKKGKEIKHTHDPVQTFLPSKSKFFKEIRRPADLSLAQKDGAVIFGHNFNWPFYWGEKGEELTREELDMSDPVIAKRGSGVWESISRTVSRLSFSGRSSRNSSSEETVGVGESSVEAGSGLDYSTPLESVGSEGGRGSVLRNVESSASRNVSGGSPTLRSEGPPILRSEGTRRLKPPAAKSGDGKRAR